MKLVPKPSTVLDIVNSYTADSRVRYRRLLVTINSTIFATFANTLLARTGRKEEGEDVKRRVMGIASPGDEIGDFSEFGRPTSKSGASSLL